MFIGQVSVLERVQDQSKKAAMKDKIEFDDELLEILYDNGVGKPGTVKFLNIKALIIFFSAF